VLYWWTMSVSFERTNRAATKRFLAIALTLGAMGALQGCAEDRDNGGYCPMGFSSYEDGKEIRIGQSTYNNGLRVAQSFSLDPGVTLKSVRLMLYQIGAPSGTITVSIRDDVSNNGHSSDMPSTIDLTAANMTFDSTGSTPTIASTPSWYTFSFTANPYNLRASTKYWLVITLHYTSSYSDSNLIAWAGNDSNAYTNGHALYETNVAGYWTSTKIGGNRDMVFGVCQ
jgi:hypothetical protein